ncbi:MAG: nucleotidyltransferase family protein, partial [Bacteroidales bacterium]
MNNNPELQQLLPQLRVILPVICGPESTAVSIADFTGPDIEKLIALTEKHRVTPLFFRNINKNPGDFAPEPLSRLRELTKEHTLKALSLQSQLLAICSAFNNRGISYLAIKGPQLSHQLYSDAAVRVCVDLDFFLENKSELMAASEALYSLGFKVTNLPEEKSGLKFFIFKTGKHETTFFNKNTRTYVDLHFRPVGNSVFSARYHRLIFTGKQNYTMYNTGITVPSDEDYFLFLCQHGAAHQYGSLHWLADAFAFYHRYNFSADTLMKRASVLRLTTHLKLTLILLNRLCGATVPEELIREYERSRLLRKLFRVCVHSINRT